MRKHDGRKRVNAIALTLSLCAMAFGLFWLAWILFETLLLRASAAWRCPCSRRARRRRRQSTRRSGQRDRRLAASWSACATAIGTPIGIMAGIYLAEYGQKTLARPCHAVHQRHPAVGAVDRHRPVRLRGDRGATSSTFSGWAGAFALALIVIPVVVRTTENMLRAGPQRAARSRVCARRAEVEGDLVGDAEGGARRRRHRRAAGPGAHRRRDRAAAVHRAQQPVLQRRPERSRWPTCRWRSSSSR